MDKTALELLKPVSGNAQFVDKVKRLEAEIVNQNAETEKWHKEYQLYKDEYHRLVKEREKLIKHIDKLKQEFSAEQAKTSETEKHIAELTDKSVAIAEMGERLNAIFWILLETVKTGIIKKILNQLTRKL